MQKQCTKCKQIKDKNEFSNNKNYSDGKEYWCKFCKNKHEKEYRYKNIIKTRERYKYNDLVKKERIKIDKQFDIREWARIWKGRPKENPYRLVQQKFLDARRTIPIDILVKLANEALKKIPYMQFAYKTKSRGYTASVDRIDSSKPYEVDNIQIIPFWLNAAKLDMSYNEIYKLINQLQIIENKNANN